MDLLAEEEKQFLIYSNKVIHEAAEAQRDVLPLCKATSNGIRGGISYVVPEHSDVPMPTTSGPTENIYERIYIDESKGRMGFIW